MAAWVSYAQNFEDVMLRRALPEVGRGRYVDVGAYHPTTHSVSRAFYDLGWRGVSVEPGPEMAALLRAARPDETVIEAALARHRDGIDLHLHRVGGLSTGSNALARGYRENGEDLDVLRVPTLTLADVFDRVGEGPIHWLKVDAEGMEEDVLAGWGEHPARPWVVLVEATEPTTPIPSHAAWEPLLTGRGYSFAYFDGLNRFYLAPGQDDRRAAFAVPPNVFDEFVVDRMRAGPAARVAKLERELRATRARLRARIGELEGQVDRLRRHPWRNLARWALRR